MADNGRNTWPWQPRWWRAQAACFDDTISVQECHVPLQPCRLEALVAPRLRVRFEAVRLDPEELRRQMQHINLAANTWAHQTVS